MRLIDADNLNRKKKYSFETVHGCFPKNEWFLKLEDLHRAPTVDAVPVVRCQECKHLNIVNDEKLYAHCPKTNTVFLPFQLDTRTHFCSLGKRKADNQTEK